MVSNKFHTHLLIVNHSSNITGARGDRVELLESDAVRGAGVACAVNIGEQMREGLVALALGEQQVIAIALVAPGTIELVFTVRLAEWGSRRVHARTRSVVDEQGERQQHTWHEGHERALPEDPHDPIQTSQRHREARRGIRGEGIEIWRWLIG